MTTDDNQSKDSTEKDDPGSHLKGNAESLPVKVINAFSVEIPQEGGMLVPGLIFTNAKLLEKIKKDMTLKQVRNAAHLPGIIKHMIAMPDAHQGYGFPIGGVAAFDIENGIISPGAAGYDLNCGIRVIRTDFTTAQIEPRKKELLESLFMNIPTGVGRPGKVKLSQDDMREIVMKGARWCLEHGYATEQDLDSCEEYGKIDAADASVISDRAYERGVSQLGTLGSGNHFIEIQRVDTIFDEATARAFGFTVPDQVVIMIHCGSRGFGHQVASDYIEKMAKEYGTSHLPDRELVCAPVQSHLGKEYYKAMCGAVNFAFANRQMITYWTRESFKKVMGSNDGMELVYDVCHNIVKMEEHVIDGERRVVCVHRKGATRSFGPGRKEIPERYRNIGQPVLIPGSMGTSSYVLLGTTKAEMVSFGSSPHGAGRAASRTEALRTVRGEDVKRDLAAMGILVRGASNKGIAEEAPQFYKDVDEVVQVSHDAGIATLVVKLKPLGVVKG